MDKMSSTEKLQRILCWQNSFMVHPLTCGGMVCGHINMMPQLSHNGDVELVCPKCHRIQTFIPEACYKLSVEEFKKEEQKMQERFPQFKNQTK